MSIESDYRHGNAAWKDYEKDYLDETDTKPMSTKTEKPIEVEVSDEAWLKQVLEDAKEARAKGITKRTTHKISEQARKVTSNWASRPK